MKHPEKKPSEEAFADDAAVLRASRRQTRRSFVLASAAAAAGYGFYRWVDGAAADEMQPGPLRDAFLANAKIARSIFENRALAPTYPVSHSEILRVNGNFGLKNELIPESWRLQTVGVAGADKRPQFVRDVTAWEYRYTQTATGEDPGDSPKIKPSEETAAKMEPEPPVANAGIKIERAGMLPRGKEEAGQSDSTVAAGTSGLLLTMNDLLQLPKHELVTQFKCIEGWSQIVHWGGFRMADFIEAFPPATKPDGTLPRYIYMETPDGDYYVGYDLEICRHPQTLLVTEMAGQPIAQVHGAPLRLHTPSKYGYKQIKRIGLIAYTDTKPDDYWTRLGYDWDAGL